MGEERIFAIVLAAGESRRFGSMKQLALVDGQALVARAMRAAEQACGQRTLLVAGNEWQQVASAAAPLTGFLIINEAFGQGLSASIRQAIRSINELAGAALLMLADQPLVDHAHLANLVSRWRASPSSIIASAYAGTNGPPVIFPRRFFPQLVALKGDNGAKSVLASNRDSVLTVQFEPAAVDIDTPEDLKEL